MNTIFSNLLEHSLLWSFLIPENYIYQKHFTPLEQFQKKQEALLFKPEFIPPFFLQIYPAIRESKDLKSKFVFRN